MSTVRSALLLFAFALIPAPLLAAGAGILLLAHGGSADWNARVLELARRVDQTQPVEVAFGMATRRNIQAAVDRLTARGVSEIVAVPLFVSSWSSIVTSTEYLLGLRAEAPSALAQYAKMDHPDPVVSPADALHADHDAQPAVLGTTPVSTKVPIRRVTAALNDHRLVAQILATCTRSISRHPSQEAVLIVAHGPGSDAENQRWLADMRSLAEQIGRVERFAAIDYITVRDDAPAAVRDAATAELRAVVAKRTAEGRRVLIVPLLLSFGGIERGIAARLDGLAYTMTDAALMPDDRLIAWVLEMANTVK
jgi:sirohydrochlorin ferrochelatase